MRGRLTRVGIRSYRRYQDRLSSTRFAHFRKTSCGESIEHASEPLDGSSSGLPCCSERGCEATDTAASDIDLLLVSTAELRRSTRLGAGRSQLAAAVSHALHVGRSRCRRAGRAGF